MSLHLKSFSFIVFAFIHFLYAVSIPVALQDDTSFSIEKIIAPQWPESSSPARKISIKGVPNFGKLNQHIWRSGQPTKHGYQRLAAEGLKSVVNLRTEYPQDELLIPKGIRYLHIPIIDHTVPTDEQAQQLLKFVSNPDNWPVLIHCKAGKGRAGIMAAIIRYSFDKWDHEAVMSDMKPFCIKRIAGINIFLPLNGNQLRYLQHWENDILGRTSQRTVGSS